MVPALRLDEVRAIVGWMVRVTCLALVAITLAGCDKCGNNIFRSEASPSVCKGELPQ